MATQNIAHCITLEAGSDLSASQFHFVSVAADGQVDLTGAGAYAEGVLQDKPNAAGVAARVAIGGVVKVEAGASVTRGAEVASNAAGECVDATTGNIILGTALEAGADGEIIEILFHPRGAAA